MKVVIIGGGIIGLCSAYYAKRDGHEVTIIDNRPEGTSSTSTGNAGMIVPSHFVPLAAPGMIQMGLRMLLNPRSPFGFHFPPSVDQLLWTWNFWRAANSAHVAKTETILRDLNLFSRREYEALTEAVGVGFELRRDGLLMLCKKQSTLEHEAALAQRANQIGVRAEVISASQLQTLDPETQYDVCGAVHFLDDASLTPSNLISALRDHLSRNGATFVDLQAPTGFGKSNGRLHRVHTQAGDHPFDELVVATGAWSGGMVRSLGLKMPMLAGRGYSMTVAKPPVMPRICALLAEARVAVTPMEDGLRIAGTMELGPPSDYLNQNRVQGIIESVPQYYPQFSEADMHGEPIWVGNRPCPPDGLPYIGRIKSNPNVIVASGHGMMGLSLGPITGKLVSELLSGRETSLPLDQLDPNRYA
ncbi:MAG: FAD-dependent oxidoreductase [Armatimonadota bacterium]